MTVVKIKTTNPKGKPFFFASFFLDDMKSSSDHVVADGGAWGVMYASSTPHVCLIYASCTPHLCLIYASCRANLPLVYPSAESHSAAFADDGVLILVLLTNWSRSVAEGCRDRCRSHSLTVVCSEYAFSDPSRRGSTRGIPHGKLVAECAGVVS